MLGQGHFRPRAIIYLKDDQRKMSLGQSGPKRGRWVRRRTKFVPARQLSRHVQVLACVRQDPLFVSDPVLASMVSNGLVNHVTRKVVSSYSTAASQFVKFCEIRSQDPWTASAITIAGFIRILCLRIASSSLRVYISGVRFEYINQTGLWPYEKDETLRRSLRYCRRRYPSAKKADKLPVCLAILRSILPLVPGWPHLDKMSIDDASFCVGSIMATTAMLRGGEIFSSKDSDRAILRNEDVSIRNIRNIQTVVLAITQPKTCWHLDHVDVPCFSVEAGSDFCSLRLWVDYCRFFPPASSRAAALRSSSGSAITKKFMMRRTEELLGQVSAFSLYVSYCLVRL